MRAILYTAKAAHILAPPRLADEQINCGPSFEDEQVCGRVLSFRTPVGEYDFAQHLSKLQLSQFPEAVVLILNGGCENPPRNVKALPCTKVLLVDGTPHLGRLTQYIASENFDRVVLLSSRQGARALADAGIKDVSWLPGFEFPHDDATVRSSRQAARARHVALLGDTGRIDSLFVPMAGVLAQHDVPLEFKALGRNEGLPFLGSSLIALDENSGEGPNLRLMEALASGALVLTRRSPTGSGAGEIWRDGTELVTYSSGDELVEKARYWIGHPEEASAIGAAGARWFDEQFNERRRREAFAELVLRGRLPPGFPHALLGKEVTPRASGMNPGCAPSVAEAPQSVLETELSDARKLLESGDLQGALKAASKTITEQPQSIEGYLIIAELAMELKKHDLVAKMLDEVRKREPGNPWLAFLQLPSVKKSIEARRSNRQLAEAWRALDGAQYMKAIQLAANARSAGCSDPEFHFIEGMATAALDRKSGTLSSRGFALRSLQTAAASAGMRADYWRTLAIVQKESGFIRESADSYERIVRLGCPDPNDWFGLGEAYLTLGDAGKAEAAFAEALKLVPGDASLHRWHGHALKRQGRMEEAQRCYRQSFGGGDRMRRRPSPKRRRIVFIAQNSHSWPCMASVHAAFSGDGRWETTVVALPWAAPAFTQSSQNHQDNVFQFLQDQRIPHVRWDSFSLEAHAPDIVFIQDPYDVTRPPGWRVPDLIKAGHRLCYVPYAIELGGTYEDVLFQFNLPLQQLAWAVFARSEAHRDLFGEHCLSGNRHVIATGHPKFDLFGHLESVPPNPDLVAFAKGRPLVLWNPHFSVKLSKSRFGEAYSTFRYWRKFMLEEFQRRQDLAFVIRPHPLLFSNMERCGIMTRAEIEAFEATCEASGNIRIDRSSAYHPVLAAASAMVSDLSSVMIEFGISGRPVCYLHNPTGPMCHLEYELDFDYVRHHCTWATTERQISAFLDRVAAEPNATSPARVAELSRRMGLRPDGIGNAVKLAIEERLASESQIERRALN